MELHDSPNRRTVIALHELDRVPPHFPPTRYQGQQICPGMNTLIDDKDVALHQYNDSAASRTSAPDGNYSDSFNADVSTPAASDDGAEIGWGQESDTTVVPKDAASLGDFLTPRDMPLSLSENISRQRAGLPKFPLHVSTPAQSRHVPNVEPQESNDL